MMMRTTVMKDIGGVCGNDDHDGDDCHDDHGGEKC